MPEHEYPYQTFERITGEKWPGGRSRRIRVLLAVFNIKWPAGSAEANIALQQMLLFREWK